jgi:FAD/FMN-containing dehydrogenase
MSNVVPRRLFLQGSVAVAVAAWSPQAKSWTSAKVPGSIAIPSLDGQLLTDAASLSQAADDFGHIIHRTPTAVLVPGSVSDIEKLIRFARKHGIKVAASRGLGESHSTFGQSQVDGGVVIDMRALATIHEVNQDDVLVDAGVRWIEILQQTTPLGKSPPTLTDYIDLSVGGTLSVGGIGGQVFRQGFQVDNVLELEVVTGKGQRVWCSPKLRPFLFSAIRAGLGQFGVITKARIRLVPVQSQVRTYTALYDDLSAFTSDQLALIDDGRFDYVEGQVVPAAGGGWEYMIECAKYFDPASPPDDAALLSGLSFVPGTEAQDDKSYFDFANRLAPTVAFLQQIGAWYLPHPWIDLFVPASQVVSFVGSVLDQTTLADTGNGPILLYPFNRSKLTAPFLRVPDEPQSFLFDLLRFAIPPIQPVLDDLVAKNRAIYDASTAIGAKRYPISSVPVTQSDWQQHFSPLWGWFQAAKDELDPDNVLTPGQGIF